MDTLVQIPGGNPNGRRKYFLNNETTAMKLKQAASNLNIEVVTKSKSISVNFSTGSYVATVLPLVKAWQEMEGDWIDVDQVDGMKIKVTNVEMKQDMGSRIVGYLVRMDVEGHEVTIHLYDTTLSILVQASLSVLQPYCSRALVPYLEKQILLCKENIKKINEEAKTMTVPRRPTKSTKSKKCVIRRGPPILELPSPPRTPQLMTLSSPTAQAAEAMALPWAATKVPTRQQPEIMIQAQNILELTSSIEPPFRPISLSTPSNSVQALPPFSPTSLQVAPLDEAAPPYLKEAGPLPEVVPSPVQTGRLVLSTPPQAAPSSPQAWHDPGTPVDVLTPGLLARVTGGLPGQLGSPLSPIPVTTTQENGHEDPPPSDILKQSQQTTKEECLSEQEGPHRKHVAPLQKEAQGEAVPDPEELLYPLLTQAGHRVIASFHHAEEQDEEFETVACNPCNKCEKVFTSQECLKNHMETMHERECLEMNYDVDRMALSKSGRPILPSPNFGSKHNKFRRTMNLDIVDDDYDSTSDENDESDHDSSTEEAAIFECDKCEYVDSWAANLLIHKTEHHRPNYHCAICGYQAINDDDVKAHIENVHSEPIRVLSCTVCDKTFTNVANLQDHILASHCMQSDGQVVELLRMHQQLLNTVLANQATFEQRVNNMALKQSCMASDIKDFRTNQLKMPVTSHVTHPLAGAPTPPLHEAPPASASHGAAFSRGPPERQSYADRARVMAPQHQLSAPPQVGSQAKKIAWVADSIGHHADFGELEKIVKSRIKKRKAYGAVKASCQRYPEANFTDVVPKEIKDQEVDTLIIQASSVDLTNIPAGASEEYCKQEALISSTNMVTTAKTALINNPNIKKVIIMETVPRYDNKHKLNKFAQEKLQEANEQVNDDRILIGKHNLECEGGLRLSRYGDERKVNVDWIHLRGTSGLMAYTRSVASILAGAGLTSAQEAVQVGRNKRISLQQGGGERWDKVHDRRGKGGPRRQEQLSTFQLATQNRFGSLGNC